jgi:hypothetical protein
MSGAWSRRYRQDPQAPLQQQIDPEHLNPTDNPEFVQTPPAWMNSAPAPQLPGDMLPGAEPGLATGIGPVDHTPLDPSYGVGPGPGLTTLESQDVRGIWHSDDQGAYAARAYITPIAVDGAYHLEVSYDQQPGGDSPQTLQLDRTGIGQPNDPEATARGPAKRWKRWRDRYIDMHRFPVQMRPAESRYARPNPTSPPVNNGGPTDSPYDNSVGWLAGPADRFVAPLVRRTPGAWDETLATDGTNQTIMGSVNAYGLPSWGQ